MGNGQLLVVTKHIARLTNGPHNIINIGLGVMRCREILNEMMRLIECRPHKLRHARIKYHKLLVAVFLDIDYPCNE